MLKLSKSFSLGLLLALIAFSPLHAQMAANAPADDNALAATGAPAGQAPDEVMKKLGDLIHAGKYADAQQLTTGLLLAYPSDQRLIKSKALLDKLPTASVPANALSGSSQPASIEASAQPAANPNAGALTGMEKVDYNALIEQARQAQQTADLSQQKTLLKQFMGQSATFLQRHPDQMLLWQLRVASAISLDDPRAGYEAGQKLLAAGAADSNDPNLQRLLAQLKNKDWMDAEGVAESMKKIAEDNKVGWLLGTWSATNTWFSKAAFDYGRKQNIGQVEFVKSGDTILGYWRSLKSNRRDIVPTLMYAPPGSERSPAATDWKFNHAGPVKWQRVQSISIDESKSSMEMSVDWLKVRLVLTKISDSPGQ